MFQGKRKANQAKADAKAPAKRQTKKNPPSVEGDVNEKLLLNVMVAKEKVFAAFPGIAVKEPLDLASGGYKAPFNQEGFLAGMDNVGQYEAGNNMFVLDVMNWPCRGTPIRQRQVAWLKDHFFSPVTQCPFILAGALRTGENPTDPAVHGNVQMLSPPEFAWAALNACADDIDAAADDELMDRWEKLFRSITVRFERIDNNNTRA